MLSTKNSSANHQMPSPVGFSLILSQNASHHPTILCHGCDRGDNLAIIYKDFFRIALNDSHLAGLLRLAPNQAPVQTNDTIQTVARLSGQYSLVCAKDFTFWLYLLRRKSNVV
jgi:hypothetical protein